jgi:hypothetical protein
MKIEFKQGLTFGLIGIAILIFSNFIQLIMTLVGPYYGNSAFIIFFNLIGTLGVGAFIYSLYKKIFQD